MPCRAVSPGGAAQALRAPAKGPERDRIRNGFFWGFSTLATIVPCIVHWQPLSLRQAEILIQVGGSSAAARYCLTGDYRSALPRDISIYDSNQIIFSAIMGLIFFGQEPKALSLTACALMILSSGLLFLYNGKAERTVLHDRARKEKKWMQRKDKVALIMGRNRGFSPPPGNFLSGKVRKWW